ncbi:MAG: hypothetical protein WC527_08515 [Candidatus Margulisiibacteriota bacterium]
MKISGIPTYIKSTAAHTFTPQRVEGLRRGIKSAMPFIGTVAASAVLYNVSPDFKAAVDQVREFAGEHQRLSETASGAFFLGGYPDFLAQRTQGGKFNYKRFAGMTAFGALNGGVFIRELYDALNYYIPDNSVSLLAETLKQHPTWLNTHLYNLLQPLIPHQVIAAAETKLALDQTSWCALFYSLYYCAVNLIEGKPWKPFFSSLRHKVFDETLPKCWKYWWLFGGQIVYLSPNDLRVYEACFLSIIWFSIMSNMAFKSSETK